MKAYKIIGRGVSYNTPQDVTQIILDMVAIPSSSGLSFLLYVSPDGYAAAAISYTSQSLLYQVSVSYDDENNNYPHITWHSRNPFFIRSQFPTQLSIKDIESLDIRLKRF